MRNVAGTSLLYPLAIIFIFIFNYFFVCVFLLRRHEGTSFDQRESHLQTQGPRHVEPLWR